MYGPHATVRGAIQSSSLGYVLTGVPPSQRTSLPGRKGRDPPG